MADNELGEIRRSQILQSGSGAIVDFRAGEQGGGPVSVITSGLGQWEKTARLSSLINDPNIVREPRLQIKLRKKYFRMPPVNEDNKEEGEYRPHIQGIRFPYWLVCPECGRLDQEFKFGKEIGDPSRWCTICSEKKKYRVHVIPTRFVIACKKGHISDFPWHWYLKIGSSTETCKDNACKLYLKSDGRSSGLQSLILSCSKCGAMRSMAGIFGSKIFSSFSCPGERPWIGDSQDCGETPKVVQRGASNIYFPLHSSALSIPPWNDWLWEILPIDWNTLKDLDEESRNSVLKSLSHLVPDISEKELIEKVNLRIQRALKEGKEDLRRAEYMRFLDAPENPENKSMGPDFKIRSQNICASLNGLIDKVVKVERLKEVIVQTGFTRLIPPFSGYSVPPEFHGDLHSEELDWLPAMVIKGEGIFFSFNRKTIMNWLGLHSEIRQRCATIQLAFKERLEEQNLLYNRQGLQITPTFLLLHTLAHAIIRQLALSSGYNTASIRERIYCDDVNPEMQGLLIYTGTPDADGTLGGLARLSETDLFSELIKNAIRNSQWCSSDPLCIDGISATSESLNYAACHSCMFTPETSCEYFNMFLDRALLVGTPENPEMGFFSSFLIDH